MAMSEKENSDDEMRECFKFILCSFSFLLLNTTKGRQPPKGKTSVKVNHKGFEQKGKCQGNFNSLKK